MKCRPIIWNRLFIRPTRWNTCVGPKNSAQLHMQTWNTTSRRVGLLFRRRNPRRLSGRIAVSLSLSCCSHTSHRKIVIDVCTKSNTNSYLLPTVVTLARHLQYHALHLPTAIKDVEYTHRGQRNRITYEKKQFTTITGDVVKLLV